MSLSLVPGASILGFGFNILGEYSIKSATQQIIRAYNNTPQNTWTYQPTHIEYALPDNVVVSDVTGTSGQAYVFENQHEFASHFAASAKVSASAGAFSGEWSVAYSASTEASESHYYCLYEALFDGWDVELQSTDRSSLDSDFLQELASLPEKFDPQAPGPYFLFFGKWGTHFISAVTVGGAFRYYLAVDKSSNKSKTAVQSDVELEYKAVFTSAKAEAHAEWDQLTQDWAKSRTVTVRAEGGDTGTLNAVDPTFDESDADAFSRWRSAVMSNPAITTFNLKPLWHLVQPSQQDEIRKALDAYSGAVVSVYATYQNGYTFPSEGLYQQQPLLSLGVTVAGRSVLPQPLPPAPSPLEEKLLGDSTTSIPASAIAVAILDHENQNTLFSDVIYFSVMGTAGIGNSQQAFEKLWSELQPAIGKQDDYIVGFVCAGHNATVTPPSDVQNWLTSCGATLKEWNAAQAAGQGIGQANYIFIGYSGGTGVSAEAYDTMPFPSVPPPVGSLNGYLPLHSSLASVIYAGDAANN